MRCLDNKCKRDLRRGIRIFDFFVIVLIGVLGVYFIWNYDYVVSNAFVEIEYYGLWALFIFTFLFEFLPQFISPDYSLLLAIGLGMNIYYSVLVTIVASAIGSWLAFEVGYHYGFRVVAPLFSENRLNKILASWDRYGKWFVLAAGVIPLPISYIPVVFGALRMERKDFLFWGIIPRAIGFIATGVVGYFWLSWLMGFF